MGHHRRVGQSIELRQRVRAPVAEVWRALAEPRGLERWQADVVRGRIVVGGLITLAYPALEAEIELEVVAVEPERRLVLERAGTRVAFVIEGDEVVLRHEGLEPGDELEGSISAWRASMALLAHSLEMHPGKPRRSHWTLARVCASAPAVHCFFTQAPALKSWLGEGPTIGEPDEPVSLRLGWGEKLTGRVLAKTPDRDLVLSWCEKEDSALVLRTLPAPGAPGQRLLIGVWSRWGEGPLSERTRTGLDAAFRRLAALFERTVRA